MTQQARGIFVVTLAAAAFLMMTNGVRQSFGLFIYIRNLYLIYREHRTIPVTIDPAPEPELATHDALEELDAVKPA